jgi:hypothetical protein
VKLIPEENIASCFSRILALLGGNESLRLAVDVTVLQKGSSIAKDKVNAAFDVAVPEVVPSIM